MEKWRGRVALVTGASSGIGAGIVKKLASHGVVVVACARNMERLEELADKCKPSRVIPIRCDLTKEEEISDMFNTISNELGGVDVCINNAGLSRSAPLLTSSTDKWMEMINVNVLALSICTRESIKSMKSRKIDDGFVINISSMAGHRMFNAAGSHFYMATKHMVKALTEGVNNELRTSKSNIRIVSISPGVTDTEFFERSLGKKVAESIFKAIPNPLLPEDIAEAVVYALSQPAHVQICDMLIRPTNQTPM